jgi:phenylpropionate dioxygenase-like ring-hydroxylating dioxygenase large terminal subunit
MHPSPAAIIDGLAITVPPPGRNLPPAAFTSRAVFEVEQRAIFAKSWVHVCDLRDVAQPGHYVTSTIGRTPVVILRDAKDGTLRGFLNACRHRGAKLLDGKGTCEKQIKCPYHAWSYGQDGKLLGVPYREEFTCLEAEQMGLVPVRVGVVGPLIFACIDPTAPSFDTWVGELAAHVVEKDVASWEFAFELTYELEANWKLFVENANDGYHIQFVHDVLTDLLAPDSGVTVLEPHGAYSFANVNPAYVPPDQDPALAKIRFGHIFPNIIPVCSPSDFTYIRVDPIAHDRLRLFVRSYDKPEFSSFRELRKFAFERTTDQDIAVVERTMRGLYAEGLPAGIHASQLEERIGHLERIWAEAMIREVGGTSAAKRHLAIAP